MHFPSFFGFHQQSSSLVYGVHWFIALLIPTSSHYRVSRCLLFSSHTNFLLTFFPIDDHAHLLYRLRRSDVSPFLIASGDLFCSPACRPPMSFSGSAAFRPETPCDLSCGLSARPRHCAVVDYGEVLPRCCLSVTPVIFRGFPPDSTYNA